MSSVQRLILHVGLPKTGTSALQRWCRTNRPLLQANGISYPDAFPVGGDKHQFLVTDLRCNDPLRLEKILVETKASTVLISAEGLANHLDDFDPRALAAFRDLTAGLRTEIFLVTRNRDAWLRSYYKQCVVNPKNGASDLWGTSLSFAEFDRHPRVRRLLDEEVLKRDLCRAFAAEGVASFDYDGDWFADILSHLGLRPGQAPPLPQVNESLPNWAADILLRVNRSGVSEPERRRWRVALQQHLANGNSVMEQSVWGKARNDDRPLQMAIVDEAIAEAARRGCATQAPLNEFRTFLRQRSPTSVS